ncbi:MAG: ATP synthase F1 subunit epsilon [Phycisphaeraceae bacterium]
MAESTFRCTVVTPEQQLLEQEVRHVSVPAWDGKVGILPHRAPLLAKLGYGELELDLSGGESERYFIGGGFVQMKDDRLTVLTDEATPADQIDRKEAEAALKEALARRAISPDEVAQRDRDTARARGMLAAVKQ